MLRCSVVLKKGGGSFTFKSTVGAAPKKPSAQILSCLVAVGTAVAKQLSLNLAAAKQPPEALQEKGTVVPFPPQ